MKVKRILSGVLAITIAASLCACGDTEESSTPEKTPETTAAATTVTTAAPIPETTAPETTTTVATTEAEETTTTTKATITTKKATTTVKATINVIRSDFKNAMDSYERFIDEYVKFMKKYYESDGSDLNLLVDFAEYTDKYYDAVTAFEEWESEDLNDEELKYYIEVQTRVSQKLIEVAL